MLGRVRAWLVDVFRGVSARYLDNYLAELCARWRRAADLCARLGDARHRADGR
jgi:hypothetical protein